MCSTTQNRRTIVVLAAFLLSLLTAPQFAVAQDEVQDKVSQAITARQQVLKQVDLAQSRAKESQKDTLNYEVWSALATAGERTAKKFEYASQLYSRVLSLRESDMQSRAEEVLARAQQLFEQAEASSETFSLAMSRVNQGRYNRALTLANKIQPEPQAEEIQALLAGGPEEVVAGGPGAVVPPIPDFAPAEVDAPSGVASTE